MVDTISYSPQTVTTHTLLKFLGMVSYYHHFIPQAKQLLHPLHLACNQGLASSPLDWTLNLLFRDHEVHAGCFSPHP